MAYIGKTDMLGGCNADTGDAPGQPANCKFIAPGEDATTEIANRPHLQLAENCDVIKASLDADKAIGEVSAFTVSGGGASSITIDPDNGGASDINFDGSLYLGEVGNWPSGAEGLLTLFQLLDENYEKVVVDDTDVTVTACSEAVPGGFHTTGIVTLTLSDTIPDGNYRLLYPKGTTLFELPESALMKVDVRGIHELAGDSGKQGYYVVDAAAAPSARADFSGATALQDALTTINSGNGNCSLFLRAGTYVVSSNLTIPDGVTIIGEACREIGSGGTVLDIQGTTTLTVGDHSALVNLRVNASTPDGGQHLTVSGNHSSLQNIILQSVELIANGDYLNAQKIKSRPYDVALTVTSDYSVFSDIEVQNPTSPASDIARLNGTSICHFSNIVIDADTTDADGLTFLGTVSGCTFNSVFIRVQVGVALNLNSNSTNYTTFTSSVFYSDTTVVDSGAADNFSVSFKDCRFYNTASAWYREPFVKLTAYSMEGTLPTSYISTGIQLENCVFSDEWCTGHTDTVDPGGTPAGGGSEFPVMEFQNVTGNSVSFYRSNNGYHVEDSPWVKMTDCKIDQFVIRTGSTGTLDAFSYGGYSDGLIEVLGESYIRRLHVALGTYGGEVNRPVVYVQNSNDMHSTTDNEPCIPAEINGLQVSFDTGDSYSSESSLSSVTFGLILSMLGNSVVRNLVLNADLRYAVRNDGGTGYSNTPCLVFIDGQYNTLENPMISASGFDGSCDSVIYVATATTANGNRIIGGKLSLDYQAAVDPTSLYPQYGVYVNNGSGLLLDGLVVRSNAPGSSNIPIYIGGYFSTLNSCQVHSLDIVSQSDLVFFDAPMDSSCVFVGNILRSITGTTVPTIYGTPGVNSGNLLANITSPAEPSN